MKKTYIQPLAFVDLLAEEDILTSSLDIFSEDSDGINNNDDVLAPKAWDIWGSEED